MIINFGGRPIPSNQGKWYEYENDSVALVVTTPYGIFPSHIFESWEEFERYVDGASQFREQRHGIHEKIKTNIPNYLTKWNNENKDIREW